MGLVIVQLSALFSTAAWATATTTVGSIAGEFSVTDSGAASYVVPIKVPPGTAGMAPELSLNYSSHAANGLLGMGWSVGGLSQITRCPKTFAQDGRYDAADLDSNDKLCLDGSRLVAVSGVYGEAGTEYRTELASFSKIVATGAINDSNSSFTVWTKAGLKMEYGNTSNARMQAAGTNKTTVWAINRTLDTLGNYIDFDYNRDAQTHEYTVNSINYTGNTNTGLLPYNSINFIYESRTDVGESWRYGALTKTNKRLHKINISVDQTTAFEYTLAYEYSNHSYRSRLTSITQCGFLNNKQLCLPATEFAWSKPNKGLQKSNSYNLPGSLFNGWNGNSPNALLEDLNGDGLPEWVFGTENNKSAHKNIGHDWETAALYDLPLPLFDGGKQTAWLIDMNRDSLPDLAEDYLSPYHSNDLTGWTENNTTYAMPITNGFRQAADFNGDGLPDQYSNAGKSVAINQLHTSHHGNNYQAWLFNYDPSGFTPQYLHPNEAYSLPKSRSANSNYDVERNGEFRIIDLNGDGLVDHVWADHLGKGSDQIRKTWLNNAGKAVDSCLKKDSIPYSQGNVPNISCVWEESSDYSLPTSLNAQAGLVRIAEFADVNGDGLPDFVISYGDDDNPQHSATYINTGNGWQQNSNYELPISLFDITGKEVTHLQDVNQDGLVDLIRAENGDIQTYINRANSDCSTPSCKWALDPDYQFPVLAEHGVWSDVNGDGAIDYVKAAGDALPPASWDSAFPYPYPLPNFDKSENGVYLNQSVGIDSLETITNGLGASLSIEYAALSDAAAGVYSKAYDTSYPVTTYCAPIRVVKRWGTDNGSGGTNYTRYHYANAKVELTGRGLLGFEHITTTDEQSNISEKRWLKQGFPYTGHVEKSETRAHDGLLVASSVTDWRHHEFNDGDIPRYFVYPKESRNTNYEVGDYAGALSTEIVRQKYYPADITHGNVSELTVLKFPGTDEHSATKLYETQTVNIYNDDVASWHLGRLTQSTVTTTVPKAPPITRVSSFEYDPGTGLLDKEIVEPGSEFELIKSYQHDDYGNRETTTVSGYEIDTRSQTTLYDSTRGQFPETISNALGHSETRSYSPLHGGLLDQTGANGLVTS